MTFDLSVSSNVLSYRDDVVMLLYTLFPLYQNYLSYCIVFVMAGFLCEVVYEQHRKNHAMHIKNTFRELRIRLHHIHSTSEYMYVYEKCFREYFELVMNCYVYAHFA